MRPEAAVIRRARAADAAAIVRLFHSTIHAVNARDYTRRQLLAWSPSIPDAEAWIAARWPSRLTFVAVEAANVVGFAELGPRGHVDCLYCRHDRQRMGIGSALLSAIEAQATADRIVTLTAESSITALPFFAARGFQFVRRQVVVRRGIRLPNVVVERAVASPALREQDDTVCGPTA